MSAGVSETALNLDAKIVLLGDSAVGKTSIGMKWKHEEEGGRNVACNACVTVPDARVDGGRVVDDEQFRIRSSS